jgi:hypothetical protein
VFENLLTMNLDAGFVLKSMSQSSPSLIPLANKLL